MSHLVDPLDNAVPPIVLVVDDDPSSRRVVSVVLTRAGIEALVADGGEPALDVLRSERVDVVVADWNMPGLDGPELVRAVRELPDGGPYFITLTGMAGDQALVDALEAGADDYMAKSATREELLARIRVGVRMRETRRDAAEARAARDRSDTLAEMLGRAHEDLKQRHGELQRQRGIITAVLDAAPVGIRLIATDATVHVSNRAFNEVFGDVDPHGFAGRLDRVAALSEVVEDPEAFVRLVARTVDDPDLTGSDEYRLKDSGRTFTRFTTPVRDALGHRIGQLFLHHETTKERQAERLKDEFVALASHELRTPLTSVCGYLELLVEEGQKEAFTEEQEHLIGVARRNADRLADLVGDLIFYAKAEAGQLTIAPEMCDAAAICREAHLAAEPAAQSKGLKFELSVPEAVPFEADPIRVRQMVDNLVGNAIKFTPEGGRVVVTASSAGEDVRIVVADNGIGIPADEQERLFERFFRSSLATDRQIPGTGLGLAITERLVAAHGGAIACVSTEGEGTTFTVDLGCRLGAPRRERAVREPAKAA
ncbi:MAG: ATP-binding response regulator [Miltoncostaeaceae bacterium]